MLDDQFVDACVGRDGCAKFFGRQRVLQHQAFRKFNLRVVIQRGAQQSF